MSLAQKTANPNKMSRAQELAHFLTRGPGSENRYSLQDEPGSGTRTFSNKMSLDLCFHISAATFIPSCCCRRLLRMKLPGEDASRNISPLVSCPFVVHPFISLLIKILVAIDIGEKETKMEKEIVHLVKESAIMVSKRRLINKLESLLDESELAEFRTLVKRVEHVIRAWYLIDFDIMMIDKTLFSKYFEQNRVENLPEFHDKFIIFRRGIGIDKTNDFFYMAKLDLIITRLWSWFLKKTRFEKILPRKSPPELNNNSKKIEQKPKTNCQYISVERIRLESTTTSFSNLFRKVEIQEPTFKRMIVVYRKASTGEEKDRGIHVKHFKDIPMADMELVLVALFTSMETASDDLWVAIAILSALYGYCAKIYFSFKENMETYRNLMTQSMYDKQLDSGKGTLLHLCDDVIQQEVKEVILSYFLLMKKGEATKEDLDKRCEDFIKEELNKQCDFDVDDAVAKLDKLGIVRRDSVGRLSCMPLKDAKEIIGPTADEVVRKLPKDP
ncbi:hypothetical protein LUZ60_002017 [Juncus effusus]|nr:hypothetical protein LUZ60_002017 [Juncus effusus]